MIPQAAFDQLQKSWITSLTPPDRRPIPDWLHDNWILPASYAMPGRFSVDTSRYMLEPFAAFQDDTTREISCMAAIQTGKTLIGEGCITWALSNQPGPTMWTFQTDADATEHCNQRFMAALKAVPAIANMLPMNRHHNQNTAIYFGNFFLEVNGANLTSLQRVSVRYKVNSEVWLWKAGLLSHARGRVSKFEEAGNSKVLNESQGGNDGDDFTVTWNSGTQQVWSVQCYGCKKHSPLVFSTTMEKDDKLRAGCVWSPDARRHDKTWNIGRACETVKWRCPKCGFDHPDTAETRARWNEGGKYSDPVTGSSPAARSYRWEGLVSRPMSALVHQFLNARVAQKSGVVQPMMDFTRQRRALSWKEEGQDSVSVTLKASGYSLEDKTITDKVDNEARRFMTIDRQRDHFWTVIRAWRSDGSNRLLFRGRVPTEDALEDIRTKFGVEPQLTLEDAGYFPAAVYSDCARFGWTSLKGSGENYFTIIKQERKIRRLWSDVSRILHDGKYVPLIHWASDPIKDVLYNMRTGKGAKWEYPEDAGDDYLNQLKGEHKVQRENARTGHLEWRWIRKGPNHYLDCEAMQVVSAMMVGILLPPTNQPENPNEKPS